MPSLRDQLYEYSRKLSEKNFVLGPGGNTSARDGDIMFIKPSGLSFLEMDSSDFVQVEISTGKVTPPLRLKPSSEILMHLYLYQSRDVKCIFHAHPPYLVALTARGIPIQHMFPDSVVYLGPTIPVVNYCVPCTDKLATLVRDNFKDHLSIVLKNHGAITVGDNPKTAYLRMEILEGLAQVLWLAHTIPGHTPVQTLSDQDIQDVLNLDSEKFRQKLMEPAKAQEKGPNKAKEKPWK